MSYEKVKIIGVREIVKKQTGQIHRFLQVELLQSHDIYLNDDAIKQLPSFEALTGQECLLPVNWSEYNGKPSLNIADDFRPLPIAVPVVPAVPEAPKSEETARPLFGKNNAAAT